MSDRNQFFYKRIEYKKPGVEGGEREKVVFEDSFNLNKVIRSMQFLSETIVLLDDGHEVTEEVPEEDRKGNVTYVKRRIWAQSEIHLTDKDDISRFRMRTDIDWEGVAKKVLKKEVLKAVENGMADV